MVAALRYLEADPIRPGAAGWVQWRLGEPVAVRKGDPYVIRRLSPPMTIGGGEIVRAQARHVPRGDAGALEALERARRAEPAELVTAAVEAAGPLTPGEIARRTEVSLGEVAAIVDAMEREGALRVVGGYVAPAAAVDALSERIGGLLTPGAAGGLARAALPRQLGRRRPSFRSCSRAWRPMASSSSKAGGSSHRDKRRRRAARMPTACWPRWTGAASRRPTCLRWRAPRRPRPSCWTRSPPPESWCASRRRSA